MNGQARTSVTVMNHKAMKAKLQFCLHPTARVIPHARNGRGAQQSNLKVEKKEETHIPQQSDKPDVPMMRTRASTMRVMRMTKAWLRWHYGHLFRLSSTTRYPNGAWLDRGDLRPLPCL